MDLRAIERELNNVLEEKNAGFMVEYTQVEKNNVEQEGYMLNDGSNCKMTVYKEALMNLDIEAMAERLKVIYSRNKMEFTFNDLNKDFVLKNVIPQIVGTKDNAILKKAVNRQYLDMSVIYRVMLDENMSFIITPNLVNHFKLDENELHEKAIDNIKEDFAFKNMNEIIKEKMDMEELELEEMPLYIMSNRTGMYGASTILMEENLRMIYVALGCEDYYLLPSSIHECIVVPSYDSEPHGLKEMVMTVNSQEVDPTDKLTDSVYKYTTEKGLHIVA